MALPNDCLILLAEGHRTKYARCVKNSDHPQSFPENEEASRRFLYDTLGYVWEINNQEQTMTNAGAEACGLRTISSMTKAPLDAFFPGHSRCDCVLLFLGR